MLPRGAPLSTFRVVTASVVWLEEREAQRNGAAGGARGLAAAAAAAAAAGQKRQQQLEQAAADGQLEPKGPTAGRQQQPEQQRQQQQSGNGQWPPPLRSPSPLLLPLRSPSPSIRGLLSGRRSRASEAGGRAPSCSPPLPVSTSVLHASGTPLPPGDSSDNDDSSGMGLGPAAGWHSPAGATTDSSEALYERSIEVLTSVFRAGLAGANTDHTRCVGPRVGWAPRRAGSLGCATALCGHQAGVQVRPSKRRLGCTVVPFGAGTDPSCKLRPCFSPLPSASPPSPLQHLLLCGRRRGAGRGRDGHPLVPPGLAQRAAHPGDGAAAVGGAPPERLPHDRWGQGASPGIATQCEGVVM
jgi:hypothetical protein